MLVRIVTSIAVIVATGSLGETSAAAQPSLTPPARVHRQYDRKSENTATLLAVAGTVIPLGLFALGAGGNNDQESDTLMAAGLVGIWGGPSAGHVYATGNLKAPGLLIRSAGVLGGLVGISVLVSGALGCIDFGSPESAPCDDHAREGNAILGISAAVLVGGAIYDIATASTTTRRANARRFAVAPTLLRSDTQSPTVGLALSGAF